jgi:SAM-dependent methyltransferase
VHGHFTDEEYFTSSDSFDFYRCDQCNSIYIDPVPGDRLQEIYPDNYYSYLEGGNGLLARVKARLDKAWIRSAARRLRRDSLSVLDVGGGTGWLLDFVKSVEPRVERTVVVDLDPGCERKAREAGHVFYRGGIETYSDPEGFDIVLMLNIIEHVADPRAVIGRVRELLRPGGLAVVKTPNAAASDSTILGRYYWGGLHVPRHWTLFSRQALHRLAEEAGLSVVSSKRTQAAPFWAFSALAWLHRAGMVSISSRRPAVSHPLYPFLAAGFAMIDYLRMPFMETGQMFVILAREPV